jgi:hypothetical protein
MLLSKDIEGFVVAKLASGYSSNTLDMYGSTSSSSPPSSTMPM